MPKIGLRMVALLPENGGYSNLSYHIYSSLQNIATFGISIALDNRAFYDLFLFFYCNPLKNRLSKPHKSWSSKVAPWCKKCIPKVNFGV